METPLFPNVSGAKEFLGVHLGHDLYWDPQVVMPTVIARYGSNGYDYKSGLAAAEYDVHLKEAKRLSRLRGFDVNWATR